MRSKPGHTLGTIDNRYWGLGTGKKRREREERRGVSLSLPTQWEDVRASLFTLSPTGHEHLSERPHISLWQVEWERERERESDWITTSPQRTNGHTGSKDSLGDKKNSKGGTKEVKERKVRKRDIRIQKQLRFEQRINFNASFVAKLPLSLSLSLSPGWFGFCRRGLFILPPSLFC